jgi:hypothetical protein
MLTLHLQEKLKKELAALPAEALLNRSAQEVAAESAGLDVVPPKYGDSGKSGPGGAERKFGSPVRTRTYDPSVNSGDARPLFSAHVFVPAKDRATFASTLSIATPGAGLRCELVERTIARTSRLFDRRRIFNPRFFCQLRGDDP